MINKLIKIYIDKIYWVIIFIFIAWLVFFVYNNFYTTLNNIKILQEVKKKVAETKVNIKAWENLEKNIEWKKQPLADGKLKINPFN